MNIITTSLEATSLVDQLKSQNSCLIIGFVPTMGALHQGHLTLIKAAKEKCDLVICSIFVNPTQFNNPEDLKKYPRSEEQDANLLEQVGCDILFLPSEAEIYPKGFVNDYNIDFNGLDLVMEGAFRPGHFKGVSMVVEQLFAIVKPTLAFLGRKDFQQVCIIKRMIEVRKLSVSLEIVDTIRNEKGLALSSRNERLSSAEKIDALIIYQTLLRCQKLAQVEQNVNSIKKQLIDFFNQGKLKLEYLEIVDNETLITPENIHANCTCCIAAYCGDVRLIDNMAID